MKAFMLVSIIGNLRNTCTPAITHKYKHTFKMYTRMCAFIHTNACTQYTNVRQLIGKGSATHVPKAAAGMVHNLMAEAFAELLKEMKSSSYDKRVLLSPLLQMMFTSVCVCVYMCLSVCLVSLQTGNRTAFVCLYVCVLS